MPYALVAALGLWASTGRAAAPAAALSLQLTPMLSESVVDGPTTTFVSGDDMRGRVDLETTITGHAEIRRNGLVLRADELIYDQTTDVVTADGDVRVNAKGDRFQAAGGHIQIDAFSGSLERPEYDLLATGANGQAERIDFSDRDHATVHEGDYTTCPRPQPGGKPDWQLQAESLELDREEDEGHAKNAVVRFKDVPIFAWPRLTFPLSGARKTGWLPPTIGLDSTSGLMLAVPWYWNIAPNRDATFTPTVMARRGVDLGGEFRYLEDNYQGQIRANVMPNDRLRHRDRWSLRAQHNGFYDTGIDAIGGFGLGLNIHRVSDNDYWRDFTFGGVRDLDNRLLASDGVLSWSRGRFSTRLRALKWQTLQDINAPIVPPYDRLPQWTARYDDSGLGGFDWAVESDFTRFRAPRSLTGQPNAERGVLRAQLARPMLKPWGFVKPKVKLHASNYHFDGAVDGSRSASRVLPTFSVDGGLVFERPTQLFGYGLTQTLEPRLKYVNTPYRRQNHLPNYDSGVYDFNFATIWADNEFAGDDRIADNNLLTGGVTSRFLDPQTGVELARLEFAQRYRFRRQRVTLPGYEMADRGWSDIMLGAAINWNDRWAFDTVLQYNTDTKRSTRTTVRAHYSPAPFHTVSAAWRRQRDLHNESIDVGWQWPLSDLMLGRSELGATRAGAGGSCQGKWYGVGRLNYNLKDSRLVEGLLGLEYDSGCWIGRVVVEQLNRSVNSSTKRIMFQLELVGLSRIGSSPLGRLRDTIPRYETLGQQPATVPSRFVNYD